MTTEKDLKEKEIEASPEEVLREQKLKPLREAAEQIAELICRLSSENELFVSDADCPPARKLDTKTLKEFSAVIKELSSVICELNGISPVPDLPSRDSVRIEFEENALQASG